MMYYVLMFVTAIPLSATVCYSDHDCHIPIIYQFCTLKFRCSDPQTNKAHNIQNPGFVFFCVCVCACVNNGIYLRTCAEDFGWKFSQFQSQKQMQNEVGLSRKMGYVKIEQFKHILHTRCGHWKPRTGRRGSIPIIVAGTTIPSPVHIEQTTLRTQTCLII